ncbi:hypothetical protein Cgig2_017292 [Carnegiea gigantea]|uniref:Uncharacterized protein n=1 Tax=Carnegiea gigantea TaxID=171969 RepID=A0A9Q1KJ83_9CARY|nr:hypothetical protein Cgig2_017292 [Carnegiea gigantea]
MRHFEQLAGYESIQSQQDVEPNTEHQAEPQQPNFQPMGHTTGPQPIRPLLYPNRDETEYEMHTGWGIGTMARHLESHDILKDSGISLNQAQIFGFPGEKSGASMYVVLDEKPFVMGESQAFNYFMHNSIQPTYHAVSRGALKKMINSCFADTYSELLNYLTAFKGRGFLPHQVQKNHHVAALQMKLSMMMTDVLLYLPYSTFSCPGKLDKYKNYVGFDSPYVTQNNKYSLKYMGIRRYLNMKYFN